MSRDEHLKSYCYLFRLKTLLGSSCVRQSPNKLVCLVETNKNHADKMFPVTLHIINVPWLLRCKSMLPKSVMFSWAKTNRPVCCSVTQRFSDALICLGLLFIYFFNLYRYTLLSDDMLFSHVSHYECRDMLPVWGLRPVTLVYIHSYIHIKRDLLQRTPVWLQPPLAAQLCCRQPCTVFITCRSMPVHIQERVQYAQWEKSVKLTLVKLTCPPS